MKISLKLEYKEKVYESDVGEINESQYKETVKLIEQIASGKVGYFSFHNKGVEYYFPEDIIKQSIILIIKH